MVNPLTDPTGHNVLYYSSRPTLWAPGPAHHDWHSAPAVVNERSTTDPRPGSGAVTIRKRRGGWQVIVSAGPDPLTGWQGIVRPGQLWQDRLPRRLPTRPDEVEGYALADKAGIDGRRYRDRRAERSGGRGADPCAKSGRVTGQVGSANAHRHEPDH
jgi:hypothetical protein